MTKMKITLEMEGYTKQVMTIRNGYATVEGRSELGSDVTSEYLVLHGFLESPIEYEGLHSNCSCAKSCEEHADIENKK